MNVELHHPIRLVPAVVNPCDSPHATVFDPHPVTFVLQVFFTVSSA